MTLPSRAASAAPAGISNATPEVLMLCLARLIRCAIVASGTRNARAISVVVRPPTARSVSAIADAGVSAGWQRHEQQVERVVALGRAVGVGGERDLLVRRDQADDQLLAMAAGGVGPHLVGDAAGGDVDQPGARVFGHPLARPLRRGRDERLLHRVLARREVAVAAHDDAQHLRRELAQQALDLGDDVDVRGGGHQTMSGAGALITCRTSIAMFSGLPPRPGAADASAAI